MMTIEQLLAIARNPAVRAFRHVIREGETNQSDNAYRMVNGGALFSDFSRHPFEGLSTTHGGKAAGAYQFLPTTWGELVEEVPGGDFSPAWQDLRCGQLIAKRGALDEIMARNCVKAIEILRPTWTSLPGASENSGRYTLDKALDVFWKYGGEITMTEDPTTLPAKPTPLPALSPKPARTERLNDVPAAELDTTVAEFKAAGASVSVTTQANGLYSILATFDKEV